jgi:diaminopimelate epimerase
MDFSKYEATANDFIMLDCTAGEVHLSPEKVRALCDRRRGVGADGVIVMLPSDHADLAMRIFNADGTEAQMCGNGVRALFLYALDRGVLSGIQASIETVAGIKTVRAVLPDEGVSLFTVDMGAPAWMRPDVPMSGEGEAIEVPVELLDGTALTATCVSMGNPHCVVFVDEVSRFAVEKFGPLMENHPLFPEKTNVEFARAINDRYLEVRVWERGVGETMACGTGACASLVAASLTGRTGRRATVRLAGGDLVVEWMDDGVRLTGPARQVFEGKTVD